MELYPLSDFLFTKSDFKEEFGVYEGQYQVYWFEEVTQFETYKFYAIETLPEDLAAVGFKIGRNEFYIGTLNGEWCLFSNLDLDGRFSFKHAHESTNSELFHWLLKEYAIPVEIAYSIVRIAKKYQAKKLFSNERNFSGWGTVNPQSLVPPLCPECNLPVRKNNFIPENRFSRGASNPPWNSGWQGICENCNHDFSFTLTQHVSDEIFKIERKTAVKLSHQDYMDSLDAFVILTGVEVSISEFVQFSENKVSNSKIFISTNELNYILKKLKNSPFLGQFDWDADLT